MHKAIVDNIYQNTNDDVHESFQLPNYVQELIENKKYGEKTKEGLYRKGGKQVYDIKTKQYRDVENYEIPFVDEVIKQIKEGNYEEAIEIILNDRSKEAKICKEFLISYTIYAIKTAQEVANSVTDCDIAMAEGFNWIPPYALIHMIGKERWKKIALEVTKESKKSLENMVKSDIKSKYQYEKFIKAKR